MKAPRFYNVEVGGDSAARHGAPQFKSIYSHAQFLTGEYT